MKKILIPGLFVLILIFHVRNLSAQSASYTPTVENRIKQVENNLMSWVQTPDTLKWSLNERMKTYNIHGLSIAVINNYKVEWAKGYGWADISENRPVTAQTLFQAASISKSLNGVGILKLVQDNKLDLNSDINLYLKSWKFPYDSLAKGKKINIANLLSHTAGLTVHGFPGYVAGADLPSIAQILDGAEPSNTQAVRSMFEPGIKFQYSGGGITILQLIITDITGQRYDDFMWQQVLKPMGMKSSSYTQPPPAVKSNLLATAYLSDGTEVEGKYHIYPEQAAAGLWTNPVDLGNYVIETQLSYQGKSDKVLSPEMTKLKLTPCLNGSSALGVFIEDRGNTKYFSHSGGNKGFRSRYCAGIDNGKGVVVMVNSDNGDIIDEIINSVGTVYNWKDFYNPVIRKMISVPDSILSSYVGKYELYEIPVIISLKNGKAILTYRNTSCTMYFTSDTEFFITEFRGDNKFLKNSDGKITGFSIDGNSTVIKTE